jgi:hypothetical protein
MSNGRSLCLHVGHAKTGSSFLQSAFAHSIDNLAAAGVHYPLDWKLRRSAKGGISSGNAGPLIRALDGARGTDAAFPSAPDSMGSLLVSGETVFPRLEKAGFVKRLVAEAKAVGLDRVRILLFIRNPISHCASNYQQSIKRGGNTGTIDDSTERFNFPIKVAAAIEACDAEPDVELTIRNYEVARRTLLQETAAWLGIPDTALLRPAMDVVNRSLTRGELEFQRALNQVLGESGEVLSDVLCELLPAVAAEHILPSTAAQVRLWDRLAPVMARINERVGEEHGYRRDVVPTETEEATSFTFSAEQIGVIARALGAEIARARFSANGDMALLDRILEAQGDMPANRRLLFERAKLHADAGEDDKAEALLRRLIAVAPDHAVAHNSLARLLARLGRNADALELAERGAELAKDLDGQQRLLAKLKRHLPAA